MRAELALDLACSLDPALLMRAAKLQPDDWQAELLRASADRVLLLCARQTGKSTTTAVLALHEAIYRPPALILLLSPTQRQSSELFKRLSTLYQAMGAPVPVDQESALRLELANGSRIVSLPGKEGTVRGFSGVALLVIDEAARVADELYYAVRPMLAVSGGRLIALSTPFGRRGWFHEEWSSDRGWHRVKVKASDCPRISPEFLEEERSSLGDWWYSQEYEVEFRDAIDSVFSRDAVTAAVSGGVPTLFGLRPTGGAVPTSLDSPPSSPISNFVAPLFREFR